MEAGSPMTFRLVAAAFLVAAGLAILILVAPHASASAIIDNGVVSLGVNDKGQLTVANGPPSANCAYAYGSATALSKRVTLRYLPTGDEAMDCDFEGEGWGAAYNGVMAGWIDNSDSTSTGVTVGSFTSTASTATSVTTIGDLQITHAFHPSSDANVYQVDVTLRNVGVVAASNVQYRRTMDWGSAGSGSDINYVSIDSLPAGGTPPVLLSYSSTRNLAASPSNPFTTPTGVSGPPAGPPVVRKFGDEGSLFDFHFGTLAPAQEKTFTLFYGAAGTKAALSSSLTSVGATFVAYSEAWEGPSGSGPPWGSPVTFGLAIGSMPAPVGLKPIPKFHVDVAPCNGGKVAFHDDGSYDPDGTIVSRIWYLEGMTSSATDPVLTYWFAGPATASLTVTDNDGNSAAQMISLDLPSPDNCPPVLDAPNQVIGHVGSRIRFCIRATDPENDPVTLAMSGLPADATFLKPQHCFDWIPSTTAIIDCVLSSAADGIGGGNGGGGPIVASSFYHNVTQCTRIVVLEADPALDTDLDGIADMADNCPTLSNHDQVDSDHDSIGDACQEDASPDPTAAPGPANLTRPADTDVDGVADASDNCPNTANPEQADADSDRIGDMCDADMDGDGVANAAAAGAFLDNCPLVFNPDQADKDDNGIGDVCAAGPPVVRARSAPENPESVPATLASPSMGPVALALLGAAAGGIVIVGILLAIASRKRGP